MRKMGLDIGTVRIGIALSDPLNILSSGYETYHCKSRAEDLMHIQKIVEEKQVEEIVVGNPLNFDGTDSKMTEYVKLFCEDLKKTTLAKIVMQDERLTSLEAEEILISQNVSREKRKELIDKVAATIILQSYLNLK